MRKATSAAGIAQNSDGSAEIPASQRADGTTRATIRIRPGYVPPEDKPKYRPPRTRAETSMESGLVKDKAVDKVKYEQPATSAKDAQKPSQKTAKEVLSAWTNSGWKGAEDVPSRFASGTNSAGPVALVGTKPLLATGEGTSEMVAKPARKKFDKNSRARLTKQTQRTQEAVEDENKMSAAEVEELERALQGVKLGG